MSGASSAPFEVRLTRRTVKEVSRFEPKIRAQIALRLQNLKNDPRPHDSASLRGQQGAFRIDVGEYRILYDVDYQARMITVWRIGHRKDVYRNL